MASDLVLSFNAREQAVVELLGAAQTKAGIEFVGSS